MEILQSMKRNNNDHLLAYARAPIWVNKQEFFNRTEEDLIAMAKLPREQSYSAGCLFLIQVRNLNIISFLCSNREANEKANRKPPIWPAASLIAN